MKKENRNLQRIITLLILIIFALVYFIVFDKTKQDIKTSPKESTESIESIIESENTAVKDYTKEELISILKKEFTDKDKLEPENIDEWNIEKVMYLGHFEIAPNTRYYAFEGYFSCKDNQPTCVYQEQTNDDIESGKFIFSVVLTIDENENVEMAGSYVPTADQSFIQVNKTID